MARKKTLPITQEEIASIKKYVSDFSIRIKLIAQALKGEGGKKNKAAFKTHHLSILKSQLPDYFKSNPSRWFDVVNKYFKYLEIQRELRERKNQKVHQLELWN